MDEELGRFMKSQKMDLEKSDAGVGSTRKKSMPDVYTGPTLPVQRAFDHFDSNRVQIIGRR